MAPVRCARVAQDAEGTAGLDLPMLRPDAKRSPHPFDELPAPDRKALAPLRQALRCSAVQRRLDPLPMRHRQSRRTLHAQGLCERAAINEAVALRRHLDLVIAPSPPLGRVPHHASPDHVEVDVDQAARQVFACFDRRGVVPIFPERPVATLSVVITLGGAPSDQLHAAGDRPVPLVAHQQMDVLCGALSYVEGGRRAAMGRGLKRCVMCQT